MAARIGIGAGEFELLTPMELSLYAEAYRDRLEDEARMTKAKIYSLAALVRTMMYNKFPPRFETVFPEDVPKKEMTDEAMFAQVQALNRLFGGKEA
jgi:hypothetical protein